MPRVSLIPSALMGCFLAASAILTLASPLSLQAGPLLQKGDRVAICGDSITQFGGYSAIVGTYLMACQPAPDLTYKSFGWSGEKVSGFEKRIELTILPFQPTVATILYGMNDGEYKAVEDKTLDTFRQNMVSSLKKLKTGGVRLIVVAGPTTVDPLLFKPTAEKNKFQARGEEYNKTLAELARVASEAAAQENAVYVPLHQPLLELMQKAKAKYGPEYPVVGPDGFHPESNGGLLIAQSLLKGLGCDGNIGTLTLDMASGKATATEGHQIISSAKDRLEIESTRYPFCFIGEPGSKGRNGSLIEFIPFNEELNRYRLVIENPPADSLKVTWGTKSKVFSAEALKKGINLAAEFQENPFSKPFYSLYWDLRKKNEENVITDNKKIWGLQSKLKDQPAETPEITAMKGDLDSLTKSLQTVEPRSIPPVRHSILIEPAPPSSSSPPSTSKP